MNFGIEIPDSNFPKFGMGLGEGEIIPVPNFGWIQGKLKIIQNTCRGYCGTFAPYDKIGHPMIVRKEEKWF